MTRARISALPWLFHNTQRDSERTVNKASTIIYCILGILLCLYGLVIRSAGSGTSFYLIWFIAGLICFLRMIPATHGWFEKCPVWLRRTSFVVFGGLLLLFLIVEGFILSGFTQQNDEDYDYIVVLGAQIYDSGPSVVLQYRLDKAAEYLSDHPQTICIVSGGQGYNEPYAEAEGMRAYLIRSGVSEDRIIAENRSRNTVQNIRFTTELLAEQTVDLRKQKVGIVTSDFHVFRGVSIARKQGYEHVNGVPARSHRLYLPNNMLREFCGVCKDKLFGNM